MRNWQANQPASLAKASERTSLGGLDWFTFFVADIQTGFGPFLAVYLTTQKWTQVDIGFVLSIGSLASLVAQVPGGWLVDQVRSKQRAAAAAVVAVGISAAGIALVPLFAAVAAAKLLHVGASAVLGPAIAAITLGLVGHAAVGPRLGRNARFAAIGNGLAAGLMGACGYFVSAQAVFFVTALQTVPTLLALWHIRASEIDSVRADGGLETCTGSGQSGVISLLRKQPLIVFASCVLLFHFGNAAMLPLVGSDVTMRSGHWATVLVAACIIAPQLVVAIVSPAVGNLAQGWGRRPLLLIGFAALPVRGALLACTADPYVIVAVQALDGFSGAVLGVLVPLVLADVSRGTGRFNLAQGVVGCATGIGATLSTTVAGYLADKLGTGPAFAGLALCAVSAFCLLLISMPETGPKGA